ncbi:serine/threonine-protein phosphatase 2A activator-like [Ylistrum balloti]|uniref:serine/threonine-protein phosphatase 2A activator-like n=1 Tax=Ylistrum balloti TaxID=509963 RepID=UPI00290586D7|nr:serine/threonine-protein phosphatase 2A activator-like [Ylistrum balloti]
MNICCQKGEELLKDVLDKKFQAAVPEIIVYLQEGIGNNTRIDYGTGHELSFVAFLCCLFKIGALQEADAVAVALQVFQRYLLLVRKLQQTYRMEPAGSQGVWSLDDHQFVPFIWGSSQLLDHKRILPKSFVNPDIFQNFDKDYMFLGCIKYIDSVKTGPFAEHSNQLWNISGVKAWQKVNSGLIKMYKAEVLAKFPVIQHFLFGSLLSYTPANVT